MPPQEAAGTLVATLGIQFQLAASLLCLTLGLLLGRGTGSRSWITWWAWSFGAVSLALAALLVRYTYLPVLPLDQLNEEQSRYVALLYAVYAGGKLLYLFCLLAGTWLFVRRETLPRIGVGAGLAFIVGVGLLFILAPSDLNPLVAWQAGITVPVFLICGALLAGLPRERRTRGSRLLSLVCFLVAALWLLYTPAFLEAGPDNVPGKLTFLRWLAGHNSYFDLIFEFLLGFGMILAVLDDVFHEVEEARTSRLRDVAASEARLSQIIRAASEGIILLDSERRIVHSNPAARETLRAGERDLAGESFDRFVTTGGTGDLFAAVADRAASTPVGGYELCGRRVDGSEFPLEISMSAIGSGALEGYVLILRDRTQRVRAEQERERMQSEVAQTARLETIGRMVSGVAHELNNPLTAILAFGQDLLSQARNASDSEALKTIVQQSQRCRMIVQDLLTFARSKRDDREPVDPEEIVHQVLTALQRQADSLGVRFVVSVAERLPSLDVNPAAMEQVLTNLIVNAFQAAGSGGTVNLFVRVREDRLAFVVEDDGPGLAEDVLPRLFEPFFTTKATGQGTGLGLSVSHAIVEQHGGTLSAENRSDPGRRGARFTALLPFVDRRAVPRAPVVERPRGGIGPRPVPAGAVRRVLVIDDEAPIRIAIRRYLERRGWEVEEAKDGAEALDLLGLSGDAPRSRTGKYDAIITDLKMPGVTGIELHDRLAAVDPEGLEKLVLITGDTASSEVADFVARLRQPLVQKPFDMRALADLLDRTAPAA